MIKVRTALFTYTVTEREHSVRFHKHVESAITPCEEYERLAAEGLLDLAINLYGHDPRSPKLRRAVAMIAKFLDTTI